MGYLFSDTSPWDLDDLIANRDAAWRCFRNFKPSNTRRLRKGFANVRTNTANMVIAIAGDSLNAGHGAGTGTNGFDGARALAPARHLATLMNRNVIVTQELAVFGGAGVTAAQVPTYDPRVVMGSGWAPTSAGFAGAYYLNSTTTDALTFTPTQSFDTIVYWYARNTAYAVFTVDIDGGAALETVDATGSGAILKRTINVTRGTHAINFRRVSGGNCSILGCTVYDNASGKVVDIWNWGVSGATISTTNATTNPWTSRAAHVAAAPDVLLLDIAMNDWIGGTNLATFEAQYRAYLTSLTAVSDVIIVNPSPRAVANTSLETQRQYESIIKAVQKSFDLPLIDLRALFETQEIASANGLFYDVTHQNALGYALKGELFYRALAR